MSSSNGCSPRRALSRRPRCTTRPNRTVTCTDWKGTRQFENIPAGLSDRGRGRRNGPQSDRRQLAEAARPGLGGHENEVRNTRHIPRNEYVLAGPGRLRRFRGGGHPEGAGEIVEEFSGSEATAEGFLQAARELGFEGVPLIHARTGPIGTITKHAFDRIVGEMIDLPAGKRAVGWGAAGEPRRGGLGGVPRRGRRSVPARARTGRARRAGWDRGRHARQRPHRRWSAKRRP